MAVGDDRWLVAPLVALIVVVIATSSVAVRRRARRQAAFTTGMVLGVAAACGLVGLGLLVWAGPQGLARVVAQLPRLTDLGAALPNVIRPTLAPPVANPTANTLSGVVTHVRDGDTIEVNGVPIRFAHVDCAERDTEQGQRASREMRRLAHRQPVTCHLLGRRSYDREVGTCYLADGRDVGGVLVGMGLCTWR